MADGLRDRSAWLITDGKAGMDTQVIGVADALGVDWQMRHVEPRGLWRIAAPHGKVAAAERPGRAGSQFLPPWPALVMATGRQSIPYLRAVGKLAGPATYRVVLQDPRTIARIADLIWVPSHDRRRGPNVFTTLTAPHGFSGERLADLERSAPPFIAALPSPRIAVVLGGKNGVYRFSEDDDQRLATALGAMSALGASFMITGSRRTHQRLMKAVLMATAQSPRFVWDGSGDNPYPLFLAHADRFVVTADSVNMTGESCATGKPVHVFEPSGGSSKFTRFHSALRHHGATRPLPNQLGVLEEWSYPPLDSAKEIAAEITRRWLARKAMLGGMLPD